MKHAGSILTLLVFAFWGSMNTLLVLRQQEIASLDQYRAGVTSFLGSELYRERWMAIYRKQKPIGYTGGTFEKAFDLEGVEVRQTLECAVDVEPFGKVALSGTLVSDKELRPVSLRATVAFNGQEIAIAGERRRGRFHVELRAGALPFPPLELPLEELHLGDALVPSFPLAGFRVGEVFHVPCFDPITLRRDTAAVKVVSKQVKEVDGMKVDAYSLETVFRGLTSRSCVTEAGELLFQEFGPPYEDIVLKRTTREAAQRYGRK